MAPKKKTVKITEKITEAELKQLSRDSKKRLAAMKKTKR